MKTKKLVGVFDNENNAYRAIERLKESGFSPEDVSVLYQSEELVHQLSEHTNVQMKPQSDFSNTEAGAVTGGIVGSFGALFASLGLASVPGAGPLLAAGPAAAAIGGLVTGGAVGGLIGSLTGMGFTKEEADLYGKYLEEGKIIVFVDDKDPLLRDSVHQNFHDNESIIRDQYKFNLDRDEYKKMK